jgi:hypothetical protein
MTTHCDVEQTFGVLVEEGDLVVQIRTTAGRL